MKPNACDPHRETIRAMIADGKTAREVSDKIGLSRGHIIKYAQARELGRWAVTKDGSAPRVSVVPEDFAERWKTTNNAGLARHYGRSTSTIGEWCVKAGLKRLDADRVYTAKPGKAPAQPPADFAQHVDKTVAQLCERYGVGRTLIQSWTKAVGVSRARVVPQRPAMLMRALGAIDVHRNHRDMSPAGQAADYLRQFGGVWRCTETGRPDEKGRYWRRGNAVLTDAELIERADWLRSYRQAA